MSGDYLRGHKIKWFGGESYYVDTKEPTVNTWKQRGCGHCGMSDTEEGHDGCLGTLPGVMNACCGHGNPCEAYVQLLDGVVIDGEDGARILTCLKNAVDTE